MSIIAHIRDDDCRRIGECQRRVLIILLNSGQSTMPPSLSSLCIDLITKVYRTSIPVIQFKPLPVTIPIYPYPGPISNAERTTGIKKPAQTPEPYKLSCDQTSAEVSGNEPSNDSHNSAIYHSTWHPVSAVNLVLSDNARLEESPNNAQRYENNDGHSSEKAGDDRKR